MNKKFYIYDTYYKKVIEYYDTKEEAQAFIDKKLTELKKDFKDSWVEVETNFEIRELDI